jgi:hypothetical protein
MDDLQYPLFYPTRVGGGAFPALCAPRTLEVYTVPT